MQLSKQNTSSEVPLLTAILGLASCPLFSSAVEIADRLIATAGPDHAVVFFYQVQSAVTRPSLLYAAA